MKIIIAIAVGALMVLCVGLLLERAQNDAGGFVGQYVYANVTVTAYCPCERCCGKWADGVTASGHIIQIGDKFIAAPPEIPFNAVMDIPGYGNGIKVLDRGGSIKGNKLDVYFGTHQEALEWGVRELIIKSYF